MICKGQIDYGEKLGSIVLPSDIVTATLASDVLVT